MTTSTNPIPIQAPAPSLVLPEISPPALPIRRAPYITAQTHRTGQLLLDLAIGRSEEQKENSPNPSTSAPSDFSAKPLQGMYTEEEIQKFKAIYERDLAQIKALAKPPLPASPDSPESSCNLL